MKKNSLLNPICFLLTAVLLTSCFTIFAQNKSTEVPAEIDPKPFADNYNHWYMGPDKSNMINPQPGHPRYQPTDLKAVADNILLLQKNNGGWPKNYDVFAVLTSQQKDSLSAKKNLYNTTFDNGSTYTEVAALAIAYNYLKDEAYKKAALKGLDFILQAQYNNGGWPQFYPLEDNYSRDITFNDGNFEGIMQLLYDIKTAKPQYDFVDTKLRRKLENSYDRGMDCILKTQINDDGKPTAWCQQYDAVNLKPVWARKFEPASICNRESAELVLFLMRIDHPRQEIITAVNNAVVWFKTSEIVNTRVKTVAAPKFVTPFRTSLTDKVVVTDTAAPPIWTRYYELGTHKPIFCDRDSKIVYSLADIGRERRDGYAWYVYDPQKVLDKYPAWQKKIAKQAD